MIDLENSPAPAPTIAEPESLEGSPRQNDGNEFQNENTSAIEAEVTPPPEIPDSQPEFEIPASQPLPEELFEELPSKELPEELPEELPVPPSPPAEKLEEVPPAQEPEKPEVPVLEPEKPEVPPAQEPEKPEVPVLEPEKLEVPPFLEPEKPEVPPAEKSEVSEIQQDGNKLKQSVENEDLSPASEPEQVTSESKPSATCGAFKD